MLSLVQIFDEPVLKLGVVALATGNELEILEGRIQKACDLNLLNSTDKKK